MDVTNLETARDESFIHAVMEESGQDLSHCYQCGNCTAGCPCGFAYDIQVSQIMRNLQAGRKEKVLNSRSIWLCLSCSSCTTRCPNNIDVARVMDVLRHMARREGRGAERCVTTFWDAFLASVRKHGRVYELGVVANYVARTGRVLTDIDLLPRIAPKGKLSPLPHGIRGRDEIARIFQRFEEERTR
ncbi:4Fe-4S dicluster domain-containing protein [Nitratidesulfovibrio vulgaris]|jgi:heterodisulfide reductase subunit C|uniref:Heterodisulfide reductase, C subunit n=2 Tax=Nitratidesulfovibrio vulgaris TaxID=881 RepID=Q729E7_NITV2|nr:4Fe-4S dicluster domain-containing protein [Nitratidesulfovibrio vulgaris]GEB81053.1 heterodisulfide reductase subunit C [Desulfovibrio desulfuricans]HBW17331.1 heterodisulfide reductase subunit C [Desulfovibrio sp.]AAS96877.1 heterodisulfide reductase, C subunit [Nitratidesulfovibrio vulgaris str. Hildenborough]ABM27847.1 heterodisulfide reductase, C subunit [Nitratidesulfovibrio vulgaris DP4]ADP87369.1 heterodisulfide reductase subunit C [Nitratidesulfovibrio vulgaris RCH1]